MKMILSLLKPKTNQKFRVNATLGLKPIIPKMANYAITTVALTLAIVGVAMVIYSLFRWARRITAEALPELEQTKE